MTVLYKNSYLPTEHRRGLTDAGAEEDKLKFIFIQFSLSQTLNLQSDRKDVC